MLQPRDRICFLLKLGLPLGKVRTETIGQQLQRNGASRKPVFCMKHHTHAPAAEFAHEPVFAEFL